METETGEGKLGILRDLTLLRVATISSRGDPFVVPVRFHFDGRSIYLTCPEDTLLITNLRANRRVALVGDIERGRKLDGLVVEGLATFIIGQGEHARVLEALSEKYPDDAQRGSAEALVKVVPVRVLDLLGREL